MNKKCVSLVVALVLLSVLAACSGEEPIDVEAVEATLATQPEIIETGSPVQLRTEITGIEVGSGASVSFDIRTGDKPALVNATNEGGGVFSGDFTFPDKGIQTVYIHLYVDDLHLTMKKWVEVK